jgi:hypothetical protein
MAQIGSILHSSRTVGAKTLRYPSAHWKGPINYGDHVLQMGISGWSYSAKASQFAEAWRSFGQLVREIKGIYERSRFLTPEETSNHRAERQQLPEFHCLI